MGKLKIAWKECPYIVKLILLFVVTFTIASGFQNCTLDNGHKYDIYDYINGIKIENIEVIK